MTKAVRKTEPCPCGNHLALLTYTLGGGAILWCNYCGAVKEYSPQAYAPPKLYQPTRPSVTGTDGRPTTGIAAGMMNKITENKEQLAAMGERMGKAREQVGTEREQRALELLQSVRNQLNRWAHESRQGGWPTHQVQPQLDLAEKIQQFLDCN